MRDMKKKSISSAACGAILAAALALTACSGAGDTAGQESQAAEPAEGTEAEAVRTETRTEASGNVMFSDDGSTVLRSDIPRSQVAKVEILGSLDGMADGAWDVSWERDGSVMAWVLPDGDMYDLCIAGDGGVDIVYGEDLFAGYSNMTEFSSGGNLCTGGAYSMSRMFSGCPALESIDLGDWDTSGVETFVWMFDGCASLTTLDVGSWDLSGAEKTAMMFEDCTSLTTLDVSGWDVSNVTEMFSMFSGCASLSSLDVSNWDVSKAKDMSYMFQGCKSLTSVDTGGWEISERADTDGMFDGTKLGK